MAKPIFIAYIPANFTPEQIGIIGDNLTEMLNNEYHILTVPENLSNNNARFECFNDCKGLPDVDIEKLIN